MKIISTEYVLIQDEGENSRYNERKVKRVESKKTLLLDYAKSTCEGIIKVESF